MEIVSLIEANSDAESAILKYLGDPYLLDAHLEKITRLLANSYLQTSQDQPLSTIYVLCNVRGYKQVMKFLPTDALLLEKLISRLPCSDWQSEYVLLLWIGSLLLAPFKLSVLGDNLFQRIFDLGTSYLRKSGKQRDAAAVVLAKLLTRSDADKNGAIFLEWAQNTPEEKHLWIGILEVLSALSKVAPKPDYVNFALQRYECSTLETKLALKIISRVALKNSKYIECAINHLYESLGSQSTTVRYTAAKNLARVAKKLYGKSPEMAQSVIDEVVLGFSDDQLEGPNRLAMVSDDKWHGSLLCLAEFARNGLEIDPQPVIHDALHFHQRRLTSSAGQNVRDAACYVCWSLFRFNMVRNVKLEELYTSLVAVACFDREVNIRRAAAAALQEGIGRHGGLDTSMGLDLIQLLNFQSVGQLRTCYLDLAPKAALKPRFEDLVEHGIKVPDAQVQRLASEALSLLNYDKVDDLVDLWNTQDKEVKCGVLMALGKCTFKSSMLSLLEFDYDFTSELVCESMLRFLVPLLGHVDVTAILTKCLGVQHQESWNALRDLVVKMDKPSVVGLCSNIKGPAYVVALGAVSAQPQLKGAAGNADPKCRQLAIEYMSYDQEAMRIVVDALSDYSRDKRGDVGSWVRGAALEKIEDWYPHLDGQLTEKCSSCLWRIACEPLDRLRAKSSHCLHLIHGYDFDQETHAKYFASVLKYGRDSSIALGLSATLGGRTGNTAAAEGALAAVSTYLEDPSSQWLSDALLDLGFKGEAGTNALRAIEKISEQAPFGFDENKLLRYSYNATVNTRDLQRLSSGIAVLGLLDNPKAKKRLVQLCAHPVTDARIRASEALFELGIESAILEETDWALGGYQEAAKQLAQDLEAEQQ